MCDNKAVDETKAVGHVLKRCKSLFACPLLDKAKGFLAIRHAKCNVLKVNGVGV